MLVDAVFFVIWLLHWLSQIQCVHCRRNWVALHSHTYIGYISRTINRHGSARLNVEHFVHVLHFIWVFTFRPDYSQTSPIPYTLYYSQNYAGIIGASLKVNLSLNFHAETEIEIYGTRNLQFNSEFVLEFSCCSVASPEIEMISINSVYMATWRWELKVAVSFWNSCKHITKITITTANKHQAGTKISLLFNLLSWVISLNVFWDSCSTIPSVPTYDGQRDCVTAKNNKNSSINPP